MQHLFCLPPYLILTAKPRGWYCPSYVTWGFKSLVFYQVICLVGEHSNTSLSSSDNWWKCLTQTIIWLQVIQKCPLLAPGILPEVQLNSPLHSLCSPNLSCPVSHCLASLYPCHLHLILTHQENSQIVFLFFSSPLLPYLTNHQTLGNVHSPTPMANFYLFLKKQMTLHYLWKVLWLYHREALQTPSLKKNNATNYY